MPSEPAEDPKTDIDLPRVPGDGRGVDAPRLSLAPSIPGYRIDGVIGRGTTGTVYRAVQLAVERDVALKVLHPELAQRVQVVQRLQREARTMARLAHPHVVGAIDMGQVEGRWWFAMELVDGPSLAQLLRTRGPLTEREALRLFAPLCEALEHLWEHGVVHRDVKPANILLERAGRGDVGHYRARLADLGLAVAERDPLLTGHGGTLGTPHYISPEQSRDARNVDVRSDLWALGATLFHAVCGRPPFEGPSTAEVLSAVLNEPIPDPRKLVPALSPGLALVIRKCLVRDPARRYQTPAELLDDLELLRERRAPHVERSELDPLASDGHTWRRPAFAIAAIVLASAAGLLWYANDASRRDSSQKGGVVDSGAAILQPLADQVARADGEPRLWLVALKELEQARDAASSAGAGAAWLELRRSVVGGLENELIAVRGGLATRLDQALAGGDLIGAQAALDDFDKVVQARLGAPIGALPVEQRLGLERRLETLEQRVDTQLAERVATSSRRVIDHYDSIVAPEVDRLQEAERWRTARALLVTPEGQILTDAELAAAGLPQAAIAEIVAEVLDRRATRRSELDRAWVDRQRGLGERIELEYDAMLAVRWPQVPPDPAVALPAALESELVRLHLDRSQAPDGAVLAVDLALPDLIARARARLALGIENSARNEFETRGRVVAASLGRRRRYAEMADSWAEFAERCERVPSALATNGFATELAERARVFEFEGRLLEATLVRAARAVVELNGRKASFEVAPRLSVTGVVGTSADPLQNGFRLDVRERPYVLTLRPDRSSGTTVVTSNLLELAGLAGALTDEQRLALVCLRWHEGDRDGARSAMLAGAPPVDGLAGRLADRLPARLLGAAPSAAPPGDPGELLSLIEGGLAERDPQLTRWLADVLLEHHFGDERVGLMAERLNELRGR